MKENKQYLMLESSSSKKDNLENFETTLEFPNFDLILHSDFGHLFLSIFS